MKTDTSHQSRGFTLIEILITTIIITVFSVMSLGGYRYFNEQRRLEVTTKNFVEILENLKKYAIVGYKPDVINGACGNWTGNYRFIMFLFTDGLQIGGAGDSNSPTCFTPIAAAVISYYSSSGSFIYVSAFNGLTNYSKASIDFLSFGSGIKANSSSSTWAPLNSSGGFSITLKNSITNQTKIVQVDRAGTITIQ